MAGILIEFPSSFFLPEVKPKGASNKYSFEKIEQYEQIHGRGFLSTGGMVAAQSLIQRVSLQYLRRQLLTCF